MNLFKNTLIFLFVAATFACSGKNQPDNTAVTANGANANNAANTVNADAPKAEANVYKDYPAEVNPKTVVTATEETSKNKKLTPKILNSVKAENTKKTEPVAQSSDDEPNVFQFSSNRRINAAARKSARRKPPEVDVKEDETNQKKDETNQKKDETKQP
jgi:hypothetical protein